MCVKINKCIYYIFVQREMYVYIYIFMYDIHDLKKKNVFAVSVLHNAPHGFCCPF